ncbi:uncharacterized protein LOC142345764 isoform X3 [Convolutriloba macropyga]|uniref:uncharacterized protein LOC142345764 isoform X3 n=1 Tax=Convolutriloba macropyga TaxID=536237 RepID=UPI003F52076E
MKIIMTSSRSNRHRSHSLPFAWLFAQQQQPQNQQSPQLQQPRHPPTTLPRLSEPFPQSHFEEESNICQNHLRHTGTCHLHQQQNFKNSNVVAPKKEKKRKKSSLNIFNSPTSPSSFDQSSEYKRAQSFSKDCEQCSCFQLTLDDSQNNRGDHRIDFVQSLPTGQLKSSSHKAQNKIVNRRSTNVLLLKRRSNTVTGSENGDTENNCDPEGSFGSFSSSNRFEEPLVPTNSAYPNKFQGISNNSFESTPKKERSSLSGKNQQIRRANTENGCQNYTPECCLVESLRKDFCTCASTHVDNCQIYNRSASTSDNNSFKERRSFTQLSSGIRRIRGGRRPLSESFLQTNELAIHIPENVSLDCSLEESEELVGIDKSTSSDTVQRYSGTSSVSEKCENIMATTVASSIPTSNNSINNNNAIPHHVTTHHNGHSQITFDDSTATIPPTQSVTTAQPSVAVSTSTGWTQSVNVTSQSVNVNEPISSIPTTQDVPVGGGNPSMQINVFTQLDDRGPRSLHRLCRLTVAKLVLNKQVQSGSLSSIYIAVQFQNTKKTYRSPEIVTTAATATTTSTGVSSSSNANSSCSGIGNVTHASAQHNSTSTQLTPVPQQAITASSTSNNNPNTSSINTISAVATQGVSNQSGGNSQSNIGALQQNSGSSGVATSGLASSSSLTGGTHEASGGLIGGSQSFVSGYGLGLGMSPQTVAATGTVSSSGIVPSESQLLPPPLIEIYPNFQVEMVYSHSVKKERGASGTASSGANSGASSSMMSSRGGGSGNQLILLIQRRNRIKGTTVFGYKTVAACSIDMSLVLQRGNTVQLEYDLFSPSSSSSSSGAKDRSNSHNNSGSSQQPPAPQPQPQANWNSEVVGRISLSHLSTQPFGNNNLKSGSTSGRDATSGAGATAARRSTDKVLRRTALGRGDSSPPTSGGGGGVGAVGGPGTSGSASLGGSRRTRGTSVPVPGGVGNVGVPAGGGGGSGVAAGNLSDEYDYSEAATSLSEAEDDYQPRSRGHSFLEMLDMAPSGRRKKGGGGSEKSSRHHESSSVGGGQSDHHQRRQHHRQQLQQRTNNLKKKFIRVLKKVKQQQEGGDGEEEEVSVATAAAAADNYFMSTGEIEEEDDIMMGVVDDGVVDLDDDMMLMQDEFDDLDEYDSNSDPESNFGAGDENSIDSLMLLQPSKPEIKPFFTSQPKLDQQYSEEAESSYSYSLNFFNPQPPPSAHLPQNNQQQQSQLTATSFASTQPSIPHQSTVPADKDVLQSVGDDGEVATCDVTAGHLEVHQGPPVGTDGKHQNGYNQQTRVSSDDDNLTPTSNVVLMRTSRANTAPSASYGQNQHHYQNPQYSHSMSQSNTGTGGGGSPEPPVAGHELMPVSTGQGVNNADDLDLLKNQLNSLFPPHHGHQPTSNTASPGSTGGQCAVTTLPSSSAAASSPGQLPQQLAQSQPPPKCIVIGQEGDRLLNLLQQRFSTSSAVRVLRGIRNDNEVGLVLERVLQWLKTAVYSPAAYTSLLHHHHHQTRSTGPPTIRIMLLGPERFFAATVQHYVNLFSKKSPDLPKQVQFLLLPGNQFALLRARESGCDKLNFFDKFSSYSIPNTVSSNSVMSGLVAASGYSEGSGAGQVESALSAGLLENVVSYMEMPKSTSIVHLPISEALLHFAANEDNTTKQLFVPFLNSLRLGGRPASASAGNTTTGTPAEDQQHHQSANTQNINTTTTSPPNTAYPNQGGSDVPGAIPSIVDEEDWDKYPPSPPDNNPFLGQSHSQQIHNSFASANISSVSSGAVGSDVAMGVSGHSGDVAGSPPQSATSSNVSSVVGNQAPQLTGSSQTPNQASGQTGNSGGNPASSGGGAGISGSEFQIDIWDIKNEQQTIKAHVTALHIQRVSLSGFSVQLSTREKKRGISGIKIKKSKDKDKEREKEREKQSDRVVEIEGVTRLLCSCKAPSSAAMSVVIDDDATATNEYPMIKFFQVSTQWPTHVKTFPVLLPGAGPLAP